MKTIKKYRSVFLIAFFLVFNLAESLYFGYGTSKGFNLYPANAWEWLCDIIAFVGVFWAVIMGLYDVANSEKHRIINIGTINIPDLKEMEREG